jgi:hypothetical protein
MGWTIPYNTPKLSDLVKDRVKTHDWTNEGSHVKDVPLRHCYRGGRFSGVLWIVHERTRTDKNGIVDTERWIECDLVRYYPQGRGVGNWGYKDMEICMGPNEISCPPAYLAMVPVHEDSPKCYCHGWRKRVASHNAGLNAQRAKVKALKPKDIVLLKEGCSPKELVIVSVRPLLGESGGLRYKIKASQLA